jgi:hypothetical protein
VDILLVVLATVAVSFTAAVPSAKLAGRSVAVFCLAWWLCAWVEVVAVALGLSLVDAFERGPMLVAIAALLLAALAVKHLTGTRLPPLRDAGRELRDAVRDPVLAVLAGTSAAAYAYVVALGIFVAPNEDDALAYHLLRAALWRQDHAIGWLGPYVDGRANAFPPLAEIGVASTMVIGESERLVALPQLAALPVAAVAAFALGRRIGLAVRPSLFGALCFFLLPFPLIQSQTALNDVVLVAMAGAAAVFVVGRRTEDLALTGIAVALMVATKTPAFFVLPTLALLAWLSQPRRRLPRVAAVGAAAIAIGSSWYVVTIVYTGTPTGGLRERNDPLDPLDVVGMIGRFLRYVLSSLELPSAPGYDRLLYPLVGAVFGAIGIVLGRRAFTLAGAIVASTALLLPVARGADRVWLEAWTAVGRSHIGRFEYPLDPPYARYTGPAGLLLLVVSTVVGIRLLWRGVLPRPSVALLAAPLLTLLPLAILIGYSQDNPRLALGGVVLAAGTWGLAYRIRAVAVAAATLSALLALTGMVWYPKKPAGLQLLGPVSAQSAWTQPRWVIQEKESGTSPFLRLVAKVVPEDARIAVGGPIDPYTFFGRRLRRHVEPVSVDAVGVDGNWLVLPRDAPPACPSAWSPVTGPPGQPWALYRRSGPDCPVE